MKMRYIFCIMCLMLMPVYSDAGWGEVGQKMHQAVARRMSRMLKTKRTSQMTVQVRPIRVERNRTFGLQVLNATRKDMGVSLLPKTGTLQLAKKDWNNVLHGVDMNRWASALVERFGEGEFESYIISDLSSVDALTGVAMKAGRPVEEALQKGVEQAAWGEEGYFVVAVKGNGNRLKDVVVMDFDNQRWISLNKSKGAAIAHDYVEFSKQAAKERAEASYPLEQQGVWVEYVHNSAESLPIRITEDGLVWRNLRGDLGVGADIEKAWAENYYIRYYPHEHKALYAEGRDYPFFSSVEEVQISYLASVEGLEVEVVNHHPVVKFSEGTMPNVLMRTEEGLVPLDGKAVTADVYSSRDVIDLVQDLQKVSEEVAKVDPAKRIIYNRPVTEGKYQPGQIEQYISY